MSSELSAVFLEGEKRVLVSGVKYTRVGKLQDDLGCRLLFFDDGDREVLTLLRRLKACGSRLRLVAVARKLVWEDMAQVLELGVEGYLLGPLSGDGLKRVMEEIEAGAMPISLPILRRVMKSFQPVKNGLDEIGLSGREREVLEALARGLPYKQITAELKMAMGTVRTHVRGLYKKMGVHCRTEAVVKFLEMKM